MRNYIKDENPFNLAGPPTWWLKKLWEFDDSLVVLPSRMNYLYRLAQKRKPSPSADVVNSVLYKESDTQMLSNYNLVPVTTILATANWSNPFLFEELRRRAPWRNGGAQACIERVEADEAAAELAKRQTTDQNLSDTAKDAWGLYNKKIGLRSQMWSPKTPNRREKPTGRAPAIVIARS